MSLTIVVSQDCCSHYRINFFKSITDPSLHRVNKPVSKIIFAALYFRLIMKRGTKTKRFQYFSSRFLFDCQYGQSKTMPGRFTTYFRILSISPKINPSPYNNKVRCSMPWRWSSYFCALGNDKY